MPSTAANQHNDDGNGYVYKHQPFPYPPSGAAKLIFAQERTRTQPACARGSRLAAVHRSSRCGLHPPRSGGAEG
jgi:hypothetical protein